MWDAVGKKTRIPINVDHNRRFYCLEYATLCQSVIELDDEIGDASIDYCPFCGRKISVHKYEKPNRWKNRKTLCGGVLSWFDPNVEKVAPPRMFEYDHRHNQFYLHNRKGFGDGFTPVKYCIYCGEPLSEMIEKHGLPEVIKDCLHTDEWWKKRGL
jgi:hypothetical protein